MKIWILSRLFWNGIKTTRSEAMRDELMQFLIDFAWFHNIGLEIGSFGHSFRSYAIPASRLVIVNTNWQNKNEVPFSFAHELGHIMNGDTGIRYYDSGTINSKSEYHANEFGIKLLLRFCDEHDISFNNPIEFCEYFGIPMKLEYIVTMVI